MTNYPLAEQKLVYRTLHRHLTETPELMDGEFLSDLQVSLQKAAQAEGVDIADHGAWDEWLGNVGAPSCEVRVQNRRTFGAN